MKVNGSIALVTGANRGLGQVFARELVNRGAAKMYAAARDPLAVTEPGVIPARSRDERIISGLNGYFPGRANAEGIAFVSSSPPGPGQALASSTHRADPGSIMPISPTCLPRRRQASQEPHPGARPVSVKRGDPILADPLRRPTTAGGPPSGRPSALRPRARPDSVGQGAGGRRHRPAALQYVRRLRFPKPRARLQDAGRERRWGWLWRCHMIPRLSSGSTLTRR